MNLAVVTNIIPYILSMAALGVMQKQLNVPVSKATVANVMAFIGAMYSFYALYSSGETLVMLGFIATFFVCVLYGAIYRSQQNTPLKHA